MKMKSEGKMNIHVIFTGGTIGSSVKADGRVSDDERRYYLLEKYEEQFRISKETEAVSFTCREPYRILSENLSAHHWNLLFDTIRTIQENAVKTGESGGIIITHGTDTLAFTAAMLSLQFAKAPLPMVLVSAAYVLDDPRTNGVLNFHGAVRLLQHLVKLRRSGENHLRNHVLVSYANEGCQPVFYYGDSLLAHQTFSADLACVKGGIFGWLERDEVVENSISPKNSPEAEEKDEVAAYLMQIPCENMQENTSFSFYNKIITLQEESPVLWLRQHVGMSYPAVSRTIKAVLLESYHSGTICISRELECFAKEMQKKQIPIYVVGYDEAGAEYETISAYRRMGIRTIKNQSPIYVYCGLWLYYFC
ncbi:MAG: asparaginase domain-containing protein [Lachnospiraceae bacterium]